MLEMQAARAPEQAFLRTANGEMTYAEVLRGSLRLANELAAEGVQTGASVVALMHNSLEHVLALFGVVRLGAVYVPISTTLVGPRLAATIHTAQARVVFVDGELLPQLQDVLAEIPLVTTIILNGRTAVDPVSDSGVKILYLNELLVGPPALSALPTVERDELDPAVMLFTSGTTGPSKGCVLSNRYLIRQGQLHAKYLGLTVDDVLYCPFPMFHIDAVTLTVVAALVTGGTAALGRGFSASRFWDEVRSFGATVFNFMGATLTILWKQPHHQRDGDHRVRLAWGVPMPDWTDQWQKRFGFPLYEVYGLTDAGVPVYDPLDTPKRAGSCGKVIAEYQLTIADDTGVEVPSGTNGEILIRPREPGTVMNEYFGMPDSTAYAFRDGWFHTGDIGRLDDDGFLYFVGRSKDVIRRRGENISAFEVEQLVESHPSVLEAAVIGVPSDLTEEDLKVVVVLRAGRTLTPEELVEFCSEMDSPHMVPRYVQFASNLPRTPTQKIEKFRLIEATVPERTWDRESRSYGPPGPAADGQVDLDPQC